MHYTPTYSSWLNQVEFWFNIITQEAIRRGTFRSVKELVAKIENFVAHYNAKSKPFMWTTTADSISGSEAQRVGKTSLSCAWSGTGRETSRRNNSMITIEERREKDDIR